MPTVREDLASRGAPLEYWFLRLHTPGLAFLVDYIVRRPIGQAEVRVSLWLREQGRVARSRATAWRTSDVVAIADNMLDADRSRGRVDDIEWDLAYESRQGRAAPRVPLLSRLHPFDLELISRPRMVVGGRVTVAGEHFALTKAPGTLTHYWGRRLPDRWRWISADGFGGRFGDADLAVEAVTMATRMWGRRPSLAVGYLWTWRDGRDDLVISPLTGLITVTGSAHDYTLEARRAGGTTRLHCSARPDLYNDLGEGIRQTLHGVCAVIDDGPVAAQAGLEYRELPRPISRRS